MELVSFTVQNYRSIVSAYKLPISKSTVLVGPNNEGKSNILKALVSAMRILSLWKESHVSETGRFLSLKRNNIYDWELDFPIALQASKPNGASTFDLEFKLNKDDKDEFWTEVKSRLNETLPIRITIDAKKCTITVVKKGRGGTALSAKSKLVAAFISKRIECDYIPAIRTAESAHKIVTELVSRELSTIESDPKFKEAMNIIGELQRPLLERLGESIRSTLVQFLPSVKSVAIDVEPSSRYGVMRRSCEIVVDDGTPTPLEYKGDGVQSLAALGIMRHASASSSKGKSVVIALEEPESHLHPKAIHQLREVVEELAEKHQVVVTTHCPLFVNRVRFSSNIVVNNRKAKPAKSIEDIRDVLGVRASDNLRHADLVLIVEGEDDVRSLSALLRFANPRLRQVLDNGTLAIDSLGGGGNLGYKLGLIRDALCLSHVFLDHDDAGKKAFEASKAVGLLLERDVNFSIVQGQNETEFEDLLDPAIYADIFTNDYRISISNHPKFKGREKWSERVGAVLKFMGKPWNDRTKEDLKRRISELVALNPDHAIHAQRKSSFDALVAGLLQRLDEITNARN